MNHLDHPSNVLWNERRQWFEAVEEATRADGNYAVSEQACALTADVQATFCAGAWVGVVILAMAVIDAALRETELPDFQGSTYQLIESAGVDHKTHALRRRRNALVHVNPDSPAITVDQQWGSRESLEEEAKEAVRLMFETFYMSPWL